MLDAVHTAALSFCATLALTAFGSAQSAGSPIDVDYFETKVRPLLASRCYGCHGPKKQSSGLRLDRIARIRRGGSRGPVLVAGAPDRSRLVQAVRYTDRTLQMPPRSRLPREEIETLTRWVAGGAPMPAAAEPSSEDSPDPDAAFDIEERKKHWSFAPLGNPAAPPDPSGWSDGPVDRFVRHGLTEHGLTPAAPADRRTLVRRAYFDLVGLPPSPREVADFVADRSPFAWRRLIDRLLASPHFGERWGRHWLDLVRYAESRGHEYDYVQPNVWQYRDYVIRALNRDVPYDRFVVEHVAGDLVASPRRNPRTGANESILGTGFWFLGEEVHSPVDTRVEECDRIDNKVDVFSKAFLGLTVSCARCHDHKFDAITTADYYALSGYLLSSDYAQVRFESMDHNARIAEQLHELERSAQRTLGRAVARAYRPLARELADLMQDARRVRRLADELDPETTQPVEGNVLFEDFESGSYALWQREGSAFGPAPRATREVASWQGELGHRGNACANTHNTRRGENSRRADRHVGRLTSAPFTISHDYIHFLIGGGDHAGRTCMNLKIEGQVLRTAVGPRSNKMRHASFDVRGLRGRRAKLEIVDSERGPWGHIGIDHIVFSNEADRSGFDLAAPAGLYTAARHVARSSRFSTATLLRATHQLPRKPKAKRPRSTGAPSTPAENVVDYGDIANGDWLTNGPTFGPAPRRAGTLILGDSPADPVIGITRRTAAEQHHEWDRLTLAKDTEREPSQVRWIQAGRTLRTPTVVLKRKKLWYLVRGRGHALAIVDSHRLIDGPLHRRNILKIDAGPEYRWIGHDVSDYVGRRVLVEFSPTPPRKDAKAGRDTLCIAKVVQADREPRLDRPTNASVSAPQIEASLDALAADRTRPADARRIGWLLARRHLLPSFRAASEQLQRQFAVFSEKRKTLIDRIRRDSRTAPALTEATGFDSRILIRGDAKSPGRVVQRRFLEALDATPCSTRGSGRLALARRITNPANPFTARVAVNRVWHHLFGRGIVETVDNFGRLGKPPSHPALLDWLARDFMKRSWSLKQLIRRIVLSKTYRMSSRARPEAARLDPENRWLHRMPVKRLQGEIIRDAMLAVSGSLDRKQFGRSVPLHPDQYFRSVERNLPKGPLDGDGRRSIYLAVRRNCLSKFFLAFDYPLPATARGRRSVTNVPAQALAMMNNPLVVELARRWADRVLATEQSTEARIRDMYRTAFAREASASEVTSAASFLREQRNAVTGKGSERQSWADLAHVLFNVKDFLFVH